MSNCLKINKICKQILALFQYSFELSLNTYTLQSSQFILNSVIIYLIFALYRYRETEDLARREQERSREMELKFEEEQRKLHEQQERVRLIQFLWL